MNVIDITNLSNDELDRLLGLDGEGWDDELEEMGDDGGLCPHCLYNARRPFTGLCDDCHAEQDSPPCWHTDSILTACDACRTTASERYARLHPSPDDHPDA